jgi:hypothetical protein
MNPPSVHAAGVMLPRRKMVAVHQEMVSADLIENVPGACSWSALVDGLDKEWNHHIAGDGQLGYQILIVT